MQSTYRVLIVEDEPLMREYLAQNLSALHPSYTVTDTARDALPRWRFWIKTSTT